jgi:imidazole glycerol-phosphate synthase subunit HisH
MNSALVGIVDYKAGNLKSVENAVKHLGARYCVSDRPEELRKASHLIFPGVGEANAAMEVLNATGLGSLISEFHSTGKPLLGICLGTQIILTESEERNTACLNIIPGKVKRFIVPGEYKVPHMGWNQVRYAKKHPLFVGIPDDSSFYFVHSYYPEPEDPGCTAGQTEYHIRFTSIVARDNLFAVQFHLEKSGVHGLKMLSNFLNWNT